MPKSCRGTRDGARWFKAHMLFSLCLLPRNGNLLKFEVRSKICTILQKHQDQRAEGKASSQCSVLVCVFLQWQEFNHQA